MEVIVTFPESWKANTVFYENAFHFKIIFFCPSSLTGCHGLTPAGSCSHSCSHSSPPSPQKGKEKRRGKGKRGKKPRGLR